MLRFGAGHPSEKGKSLSAGVRQSMAIRGLFRRFGRGFASEMRQKTAGNGYQSFNGVKSISHSSCASYESGGDGKVAPGGQGGGCGVRAGRFPDGLG